jgi:PDZ domain
MVYRISIIVMFVQTITCMGQEIGRGLSDSSAQSQAELLDLVRRLSSKSYREREQATLRLQKLDRVPSEIEQAALSRDPEVARRARLVINAIGHHQFELEVKKKVTPINQIGLDLYVERLVHDKGFATKQHFNMLRDYGDFLLARSNRLSATGFLSPDRVWARQWTLADSERLKFLTSTVQLDGKPFNEIEDEIFCCAGNMPLLKSVDRSMLFIVGDFEGAYELANTMIICLGNIGKIHSAKNCVIFALGEFAGVTLADQCLIQSKAIRGTHRTRMCFFLTSNGPVDFGLGLIKVFDASSLGIQVKIVDGEVFVTKILPSNTSRPNELRENDRLLSIDGKKWKSLEQLQATLRKASTNGALEIRIERDGQILRKTLLHLPFP